MTHVPDATYRLQLTPEFGFAAARDLVPYLEMLGISDIYASPIFLPREGSRHGYDVVDPNRLNDELGSERAFRDLITEAQRHELGWVQDIVPNHMAFDSRNSMLMDVLENGPHSRFFHFFDMQWEHPYERVRDRLLAPFLGKFYGEALEDGEIRLEYGREGFTVAYYDHRFPVRVDSYAEILTRDLERLRQKLGDSQPEYVKFLGVLYSIRNLPEAEQYAERYEQIQFIKRMVWDLWQGNEHIKRFIQQNLETFNGTPGDPESFDLLHNLLSHQFYRLAFWKVGTEEINYRRFFNLNEFISLNMDDTDVFQYTHRLIFDLVEEGSIRGLRIDHIDGLYNPRRYLKRLRNRSPEMYLAVEKILDRNEPLPAFWPVEGTTGYDFLNQVNGLFCRKEESVRFEKIYRKFTGFDGSYDTLVHGKKRLIIGKHMAGEVDNLAHSLSLIAGRTRYGSDFTLYGLRRSLVEILAWFPVYRTYCSKEHRREEDVSYIDIAVRKATKIMPDFAREFAFIRSLLAQEGWEDLDEEEQARRLDFVMRFQQMTGPLMAKGFEDTALYIYNRLISLNEVGGDPEAFGVSDIEFHHFNLERSAGWPHAMNATATHDTKRGEDVRARINVLSEIPMEWEQQVNYWSRLNAGRKAAEGEAGVPDANDEYLLYQTLVGTLPFDGAITDVYRKRVKEYLVKAVREAKIHTEWLQPDTAYEEGFTNFVDAILSESPDNTFLQELRTFHQRVAHFGVLNSLAQVLLKITSPGVPDFYQGAGLWDFNLVDPDNRRPVDYRVRSRYLKEIRARESGELAALTDELLSQPEDGRVKLFLTYRLLQFRKAHPALFREGEYRPLKVNGPRKDHVVAFARHRETEWLVAAVPRFLTGMIQAGDLPLGEDVWEETAIELPGEVSEWTEVITDRTVDGQERVPAGRLFGTFPGAVLLGQGHPTPTTREP